MVSEEFLGVYRSVHICEVLVHVKSMGDTAGVTNSP